MTRGSWLYTGWVSHKRVKPRAHGFRYRCYWLALDLDELPHLDRRLRWFSVNRWNVFSFYERDHGDATEGLRAAIAKLLDAAGLGCNWGSIRLLCMPRVLGFVFNPLSIYFCHDPDGDLRAIVYEVNNTFGQRHSYLIATPEAGGLSRTVTQRCHKRLYVSPFMEMAMTYRFAVRPLADDIGVTIRGDDASGPVIAAAMAGQRLQLTDGALLRVFAAIPLVTLKVVAGIHWEALRLWLKGVPLVSRPAPPELPVSATLHEGIAVADRHR